ncbi:MAG: CAP domain-containing protein [Acidimicrobiia bacterium]|nr:CAP domain-containing protein [Acidimicrobiia bacterium]
MSARLHPRADRALRALLALLVAGAALFAFARPAHASSDEDAFIGAINAIRASRGIGTLAVDGQLTDVARAWSQQMAASETLSHNPNLATQISGWRSAGENVGTGPDEPSIEAAFEASPHHFENMVDPSYNAIGVGVVADANGTLWVTEDYKQSKDGAAAAPAPAPPAPAPPRPAPRPAPRTVSTPRPASAPVHTAAAQPVTTAASHEAAAAPAAAAPVATTVAVAPTAPVAVLGSSAHKVSAAGVADDSPFSATNLTALVALVVLGASMAMFTRVRMTAQAASATS